MKSEITPLVSIIIPCFNAEKFIFQTLSCLLEIDYLNWECIIVDDGSTDRSARIIKEFCSKDNRFILFKQANAGPSVARNIAISKSQGEFLLPLDADDLISKSYISEAVEVLKKNPKIKLVYCNARMFGRKNKPWELPVYSFKSLLIENMIFCSALFRRSDYNKTNGFDPNLRYGREDWDFWIELLKSGGDVYKIEKVHFFYRTHKKSHNKVANSNIASIRKYVFQKHRSLYDGVIDNPIQLFQEHALFKKSYNILRRLTFRKPIP